MEAPEGPGETVDHRPDRRSGDGGDRARQPRRSRRCCRVTTAGPRWTSAARAVDRPHQQHPGGRRGRPLPRRARPRLRVLPLAVRPAPKGRRAASSTRRAASSRCWSRCPSRTGGRVYDPCCGSSGMFVQSVAFIRAHASGNGNGGRARADISIYGQESNYTTWRLAKMKPRHSAASRGRSRTATASTTIATRI